MNKERLFHQYREYLGHSGLHEVFAVDYIAEVGQRYGFDVYRFRDKLVALVRQGTDSIKYGANVIVSHLDSPRLDVMVGEPLVEKEDGVFLKVVPYGGIIPQSWLDIPLILVGRIYTDEEPIVINTKDEFEFTITSLLPHLDGRKEFEKFSINNLVVRVGNNKKENVLEFLKERYGIHEDDFELADLSFVPATPVRELGFDKDLITGYGHDDSCCAFTALQALLDSESDSKTQIAIFASYEETGSNQATGCNSEFIDELTVKVCIQRTSYKKAYKILVSGGNEVEIVERSGLYWKLLQLIKRPIFMFGMILLAALNIYLPGRILFIQTWLIMH